MHAIDQTVDPQGAFVHVDEGKGSIWHNLGHAIKKGASPEEIRQAASLAWDVKLASVKFDIDDRFEGLDNDHNVMYRGDTNQVLDIVGKGYVPHQNDEVLEFFAEYIAAGNMYIDTAGSLQGGNIIFVQAKLGKDFDLGGVDKLQSRVLLMNPHQYGKGMIAKLIDQRVVCWNTLQIALSEGGKSVHIPHIKKFDKARRDEAKRNLGIAQERIDALHHDVELLSKLKLGTDGALPLLIKVFDGKDKQPLEQQGRTINRLMELYQGAGIGAKMVTAQGTGWGLLNAVTQYYDHEYGRTAESRVNYTVLGVGDIKKREMMKELLSVAA